MQKKQKKRENTVAPLLWNLRSKGGWLTQRAIGSLQMGDRHIVAVHTRYVGERHWQGKPQSRGSRANRAAAESPCSSAFGTTAEEPFAKTSIRSPFSFNWKELIVTTREPPCFHRCVSLDDLLASARFISCVKWREYGHTGWDCRPLIRWLSHSICSRVVFLYYWQFSHFSNQDVDS